MSNVSSFQLLHKLFSRSVWQNSMFYRGDTLRIILIKVTRKFRSSSEGIDDTYLEIQCRSPRRRRLVRIKILIIIRSINSVWISYPDNC